MRSRSTSLSSRPAGIHLLRDRRIATAMVEAAGVGPGDLVVEIGAGLGALTAPLAATGARVLAVERSRRFVTRLEQRFGTTPTVRVVEADARSVMLPHRRFAVVANIPFAISTDLLRRLMTPEDTPLATADLIVEWGLAKRLTAKQPRDFEAAWWQARFDLRIGCRISAGAFDPPPSVDAAHLIARRRSGLRGAAGREAWARLRAAYGITGGPSRPPRANPHRGGRSRRR